jgi:RNA recognition motif-containing protein
MDDNPDHHEYSTTSRPDTMTDDELASSILSRRLMDFRHWLRQSNDVRIHPALCIVNGDATDGTLKAPLLTIDKKAVSMEGRLGLADETSGLYDRTMGCQVRTVRDIKEGEEICYIPAEYMVTADLVAASDAGQAILACLQAPMTTTKDDSEGFWDAFENTTVCQNRWKSTLTNSPGQQVAVKILQERSKVAARSERASPQIELAPRGVVSTRAPFLAFLIQQRFHDNDAVPVVVVAGGGPRSFQDSYQDSNARTAVATANAIRLPPKAPKSFGAYARTLPSSVSVPICWKRNELAVFASCISGTSLMVDACSTTMQLIAEYSALLEAGLAERFPTIFQPGLFTWERWVWAAAVFSSRVLPSELCLAKMASPEDICRELGVLVPLLDMCNHEIEENQVTCTNGVAVAHKKIRKHAELYLCYGDYPNNRLIAEYGFAQINNKADKVLMAWGLSDGVGHVPVPDGFQPLHSSAYVFDTKEESAIAAWWSNRRLDALEREAFRHPTARTTLDKLKNGHKMMIHAYQDLTYDPIFLSVAVVATVPDDSRLGDNKRIVITKRHQRQLQSYLHYTYAMKLEKLLQNLDAGLKGHVPAVNLWTKASEGGLRYDAKGGDGRQGWHRFFDSHVYAASMEVENHFYSMGVVSCALTLYDGHLKCLQSSIDGIVDDEKFAAGVLKQLRELDFELADDEGDETMEESQASPPAADSPACGKPPSHEPEGSATRTASESSSDRPAAIKLHVGNLSYRTTPSDLYDFFSGRYGKQNVLECHIPIERANGRSRGFGFVSMPEKVALEVLNSSEQLEVHGRLMKLAKSNSAGSSVLPTVTDPSANSDRCRTCGYRPRWCHCQKESEPTAAMSPPPPRDRHEDRRRVSRNDDSYRGSSWHRYDEDDYRYDDRDYRRSRDQTYDYDDRCGGDRYVDYEYDERYGSRRRRRSSSRDRKERRSRSRSPESRRSRKSSKRRGRSSSVKS